MVNKETIVNNPYIELVTKALSKEKEIRLFFSGSSMLPALKEGMQVTVAQLSHCQVRLGNLILYRNASQMIIHRVVGIKHKDGETIFTTRGDNQGYISGKSVQQDNLIGVVRNAFFQACPGINMLCADRLAGMMYVIMNTLIEAGRKFEKISPRIIRQTVHFGLRGIFFIFSKLIHLVYKGIRNGLLVFRNLGFVAR